MSDLDPFTHVDLRGASKARIVLADVIASVGSTIFIREGVVIYVEPPAEENELPPEPVPEPTGALITHSMTPPPQKPIRKHELRKQGSLGDAIVALLSNSSDALPSQMIYENMSDDERARWKFTTVVAEITVMLRNGVLRRKAVPFGPEKYWARHGYVVANPKSS